MSNISPGTKMVVLTPYHDVDKPPKMTRTIQTLTTTLILDCTVFPRIPITFPQTLRPPASQHRNPHQLCTGLQIISIISQGYICLKENTTVKISCWGNNWKHYNDPITSL